MKKTILSIIILFLFYVGFAQKRPNEFQVLPFARLDWYPEFTFNYGGRFSSDSLRMKGVSWGINFNYKHSLNKEMSFVVGLGYYRYSFTKLRRINSAFGFSDARPMEFPSFNNFFYHANNYHYNTALLNIGVDKLFKLEKKAQITIGFFFRSYLTLQSSYKTNFGGLVYKKPGMELFGYSLTTEAGLEKQFGRLRLGPKLLIPLFDIWSKDEVFLENKNANRNKWLNGIGVGFQINYPLIKK